MNNKMLNNTEVDNNSYQFNAIGTIKSPYQEKFAIPRQANLVTAAKGQIVLQGSANNSELLRGIEQFSHLWLIFVFHGTAQQGWKPLVRPPRLGGNKKMGVLATRSTFRPNPIGMSVVKLDSLETHLKANKQQTILHISGLDLLNGTPILDIKPYIPYSDALADAQAGFAQQAPLALLSVKFSMEDIAIEHKGMIILPLTNSLSLLGGYKMFFGTYPSGNSQFAVYPLLDISWKYQFKPKKAKELDLFEKKMF